MQDRHHRQHWSRPQDGEFTYVALGDSAGVGVGVDDARDGYVGLIADRLRAKTGHTVRTVNLCVSGARAADVLQTQVARLEGMPIPDAVTCVVGGNDVAWSLRFHAEVFGETVDELSARLPPGTVMGLVPSLGHWPFEGRARTANRIISRAAERNGLQIADLHSPTLALGLWRYRMILAGDWFHPNERGHSLWAEAIWPQLSAARDQGN